MNNREYLNTLSDEEFANKLYGDDGAIADLIDWLQAEHTTTADEDFAEIGFRLMEMDIENGFAFYKNGIKQIEVGEEETYLNFTQEVYSDIHHFKLSEIDQIRTIAEKKRKEMGWIK